jgi:hypothetical protein
MSQMARKTASSQSRDEPRLGQLTPLYNFFLNPYVDMRFTSACPGCSGKTKQRKLPLAIVIDDWGMVVLNKTCRYCPNCELLIGHQDQIEEQLSRVVKRESLDSLNDYFVVGTLERKDWRRGMTQPLSNDEMLAALHDFRDHLQFEPAPRWECDQKRKPR